MKRPLLFVSAASACLIALGTMALPAFAEATGSGNVKTPGTNFELTSFTVDNPASANVSGTDSPGGTLDLNLTVAQTSPDGSDFGTPQDPINPELHAVPQAVYVNLFDGSGEVTGGPYMASLQTTPVPALSWNQEWAQNHPWVSVNAVYSLTLPAVLSSGTYTVQLYQPSQQPGNPTTQDQEYTFRVGPPWSQGGQAPTGDGSWGDDIVDLSGVTSNPTITVAQPNTGLPEIPLAGALPLIGISGLGLAAVLRKKRLK